LANNNSPYFLFIAGAIAICAMILPGISGSFILVILGAYKTLSIAIDSFDFKKITIFAFGAIVGLLTFSRVLKWLFKHYKNLTLSILTGFIFGSLNKIWPWKKTVSVMNDVTGDVIPYTSGTLAINQKQSGDFDSLKTVLEESISALHYSDINNQIDPQVIPAIMLMIAGFLTIFILEKIGNKVH